MKTRPRDPGKTPGLPPPLAPPSRDANPWTMSGGDAPGAARPAGATREPGRHPRFPVTPVSPVKPRKTPVVPMVIFGVLGMVALSTAIRALESGRLQEAIGPMLVVAFVAFVMLRRLRKHKA